MIKMIAPELPLLAGTPIVSLHSLEPSFNPQEVRREIVAFAFFDSIDFLTKLTIKND
jgi:hypothetical protein